MKTTANACLTIEAALDLAVAMENEGFRNYLAALRLVRDRAAREILKDAALDELEHKLQLERALVLGQFDATGLERPVPTMNLDYTLQNRALRPESDAREALAYAIHLEKGSLDFYRRMAAGCAGAPMAQLFEKIANDETRHLQQLEDLYEEHFLTEN